MQLKNPPLKHVHVLIILTGTIKNSYVKLIALKLTTPILTLFLILHNVNVEMLLIGSMDLIFVELTVPKFGMPNKESMIIHALVMGTNNLIKKSSFVKMLQLKISLATHGP